MEQDWRKALSEVPPKKVSVSIEPIYNEGVGSLRPSSFKVKYQIEGEDLIVRNIKNRPGG